MAGQMEILSPEAFAAKVQAYGNKQVQLIAKKAAVAVFREIFGNLLTLTPVLTGHARHNWQVSVDQPENEEIEGVAGVEVTGEQLTGDENAEIESLIKEFLAGGSMKIWITNNVPYIQLLDNGNSAKAPTGMTLPAINAALAALRDRKLKLT